MQKPKLQTRSNFYNWNDVQDYIEHISGKSLRDWDGQQRYWNTVKKRIDKAMGSDKWYHTPRKDQTEKEKRAVAIYNKVFKLKRHLDFWGWLVSRQEIHNGSYFYLESVDPEYMDDFENGDEWVAEVINLIFKEFGEGKDELEFYVSW